jgi:hypothetical protein
VRESFSEYKKTLEKNLMKVSYLYNGDVISSIDSQYTDIKKSPLTSPSFIINCIVNIYQESFDIMINKSKEFIIPLESLMEVGSDLNMFDRISELGIKPLYIFCSDKSRKLFGISKPDNNSAFPSYFYKIQKYISVNVDVFYSPLIKDNEDELVLYVVDNSIQSLVYSIQNMDYIIEPNMEIYSFTDDDNMEWKHTINYNLYDCNYKSYKLVIKEISKIREDKINKILNGN